MSAEILTPDGAAVRLAAPTDAATSTPQADYSYTVSGGEIAALSAYGGSTMDVTFYDLNGQVLSQNTHDFGGLLTNGHYPVPESLFTLDNGSVVALYENDMIGHSGHVEMYDVFTPDGVLQHRGAQDPGHFYTGSGVGYALPYTGFSLNWAFQDPFGNASPEFGYHAQTFDDLGNATSPVVAVPGPIIGAHADGAGGSYLQLTETRAVYSDGAAQSAAVVLPNETASGSVTSEAVALLSGGDYAVAWTDSTGAYAALFDPATDAFSSPVRLAPAGAGGAHLIALADGGYAVSWTTSNGGAHQGETFDAQGAASGAISLAGDVAGVNGSGDLYTVGLQNGAYVVQNYAIDQSPGAGVISITGPGSETAGTSGTTDFAFHVTRTGDLSQGAAVDYYQTYGGSADSSDFAGPTAGTAYFQAGQSDAVIHIAVAGDPNPEPDETFTLALSNARGGTIDQTAGEASATIVSGAGSSSSVSTSDPDYIAPSGVHTITLTGTSSQTVHGNNEGDVFWSNNNANTLYGGTGDDTFHLGRNGDQVTGGGGNDVFAFAENPWSRSGVITDFNHGDVVDLTETLHRAGDVSGDPVAEGYIKLTPDAPTMTKIWFNPDPAHSTTFWLVTALTGVDQGSVHVNEGLITV